jgi:hypothetical protein
MTDLAFSLFDPSALIYALVVVVAAHVLLFIPSLLVTGAKADQVARAISYYLWKTFGLILVGLSVAQLTSSLIANQLPEDALLSSLILLFAIGVGIMTHASRELAELDHASVMVPRLVFSHSIEIVGGLVALLALMSLLVSFLMTETIEGWQTPVTMMLLGVTLMLSASFHIKHKNKHANRKKR